MEKENFGHKLAEALGLPKPPEAPELFQSAGLLALLNMQLGEKQQNPVTPQRVADEYRRDALARRLAVLADEHVAKEEAWNLEAKEILDRRYPKDAPLRPEQ